MIDHILGRPSPTWKRAQVLMVIFFWAWRLYLGDGKKHRMRARGSAAMEGAGVMGGVGGLGMMGEAGTGVLGGVGKLGEGLRRRGGIFGIMGLINKKLRIFSPYQLIVGTLTMMYALRNLDTILGLGSPEPLARLYSPAYYRASYIATAFDAGFATAMTIRPQWLKDICSVLFTGYYLIWAREADEKLRRFRALCTVEMLRVTWEKTSNPYIRFFTYFDRPRLPVVRRVHLPRPPQSKHTKPISAMLFFARPEEEMRNCSELILDFPGGGFIAMGPDCHEERLRRWAKRTGKVVLSIDYGKAPEYPYPWAVEEGFDCYRTLVQTRGSVIGMGGHDLRIVMTGDSAGGNIVTTIQLNILESKESIPPPVALVLAYPALDFNFTSFMTPQNLKVLRTEQSSSHLTGIEEGKAHMRHKSPLSVVNDVEPKSPRLGRKPSWRRSLSGKLLHRSFERMSESGMTDTEDEDDRQEHEKSLEERVKTPSEEVSFSQIQQELTKATEEANKERERQNKAIGTRLTMTSRTGYFQDRIISPTMMRAMAILYIGPKHNPDFQTDYYISPILAPEKLLAQFPPVYLICGEKDPFVDDTVILAGRIREAKRLRKAEAKRLHLMQMARVKEGLRMSQAKRSVEEQPEDPILAEEEEDWVQMRIIEGWGHGFMQMMNVMSEAEPVLLDVADWIDEAFELFDERLGYASTSASEAGISRTPSKANLPRTYSLVKASKAYKPAAEDRSMDSADLGAPVGDAFDQDPEGDGILTFTTRKRRTSNSGSSSSRTSGLLPNAGLGHSSSSGGSGSRADIPRNSSAPRFNVSNELLTPDTDILPPSLVNDPIFRKDNNFSPYRTPKASFGLFGKKSDDDKPRVVPQRLVTPSSRAFTPTGRSRSPAPARASLQSSDGGSGKSEGPSRAPGLTEAELMRRRRVDAVYGIGDGASSFLDPEEPEDEQERGFRW